LLLGNGGGDEDAKMADGIVQRVDNRLSVGADLVDALVEVEDPVQCLLRRRYVVGPGAEHDDGRSDVAQIDTCSIRSRHAARGELVTYEQLIGDELHLLRIEHDVPAPPLFELEVTRPLRID